MMDLVVNDRMGFGAMWDGLFGDDIFSGLVVTPYDPGWMANRMMRMLKRAPRPVSVVRRGRDNVFIQCGRNAIRLEGYYDSLHAGKGNRLSAIFFQEFDGVPTLEHMHKLLMATREQTNQRLFGVTG